MATIAELDSRGWNNKSWKTKMGTLRGGTPFTKATLFRLITNVTYIGKLGYKDKEGREREMALYEELWQSPEGETFLADEKLFYPACDSKNCLRPVQAKIELPIAAIQTFICRPCFEEPHGPRFFDPTAASGAR